MIDWIVRLYAGGLSLAAVGDRVGTSAETAHRHLPIPGVQIPDANGRER